MTRPKVTVAAMVACAVPGVVHASVKEDAANRKTMHQYAACVIKAHHKRASEAIVANADNSTIMHRYQDLVDGDCLGRVAGSVQMRFGGDLYRYALADALIETDFAAGGPETFKDRPPLVHVSMPDRTALDARLATMKSLRLRKEAEEAFEKDMADAWLSRYGECIAREDPADARLWVVTPPDVPEEAKRIDALRPVFAACLGDGTLTFGRVALRGTVALNYYRLAMTPPDASRKLN